MPQRRRTHNAIPFFLQAVPGYGGGYERLHGFEGCLERRGWMRGGRSPTGRPVPVTGHREGLADGFLQAARGYVKGYENLHGYKLRFETTWLDK
jgi:hypothetical protein